MAQSPDGVVWDQVSIPEDGGGGLLVLVGAFCQNRKKEDGRLEVVDLLVVFLVNVETVGQAGEKSFYDDAVHGQAGLQAPERPCVSFNFSSNL